MSIHAFFVWCNDTALAAAIRESTWLFPWVMIVHLLSLAVLGGTVLVVDLRLLGLGLRARTAAALDREVRPWLLAGLVVLLTSGAALFVSEALRCYETPPFWLKMLFLALALAFTFTVRARVIRGADGAFGPTWSQRLTGATSVTLWTGVALMGRAIGFW